MKHIQYILSVIVLSMIIGSCKKEGSLVPAGPISAFTVVNAIPGSNALITNFSVASATSNFNGTPNIGYGSFQGYSAVSGTNPIAITQTSNTKLDLYKNSYNLVKGGIYSLFLTGTDTLHTENVYVQDHPPYHSLTDSTTGIRFINLSTGSSPISVNVQGSANGSTVSSLAYKSITDFMNFATKTANTQYTFEFRAAAAAAGTPPLTTFIWHVVPFENITLCVIGQPGSSATVPISVMQENNF